LGLSSIEEKLIRREGTRGTLPKTQKKEGGGNMACFGGREGKESGLIIRKTSGGEASRKE